VLPCWRLLGAMLRTQVQAVRWQTCAPGRLLQENVGVLVGRGAVGAAFVVYVWVVVPYVTV
jgi:hypothetical protein